MIKTKKGAAQVPFCKEFYNVGVYLQSSRKMQEGLEERMQSGSKARWRDAKIYQSKGVPWGIKWRSMVDQVYSVFCFGSDNLSCSRGTLDKLKGWDTNYVTPIQKQELKIYGW